METKSNSNESPSENLVLWEHSLGSPEVAFGDPYYVLPDKVAIPEAPDLPETPMSALERQVNGLLDQLLDQESIDSALAEPLLDQLAVILLTSGANHLTFLSFWKQMDMNYSVFSNLSMAEKKSFLTMVVPIYLEKRHRIYKSHGYSPVALQAALDNAGHKHSGNLANLKLEALCTEFGLNAVHSLDELQTSPYSFCVGKGISKKKMDELVASLGVRFAWSRQYVGKKPDFVLHLAEGEYYIGEAKHKKEAGGGQNGQIAELIDLIRQSEQRSRFGYIAFLDGLQFNQFIVMHQIAQAAGPTVAGNKEMTQYLEITAALRENPENYFLNTAGFREFLTKRLKREV